MVEVDHFPSDNTEFYKNNRSYHLLDICILELLKSLMSLEILPDAVPVGATVFKYGLLS